MGLGLSETDTGPKWDLRRFQFDPNAPTFVPGFAINGTLPLNSSTHTNALARMCKPPPSGSAGTSAWPTAHNPQSRAQVLQCVAPRRNMLHRVATLYVVMVQHVALCASCGRSPAALCSADPPPLSDGAAPAG